MCDTPSMDRSPQSNLYGGTGFPSIAKILGCSAWLPFLKAGAPVRWSGGVSDSGIQPLDRDLYLDPEVKFIEFNMPAYSDYVANNVADGNHDSFFLLGRPPRKGQHLSGYFGGRWTRNITGWKIVQKGIWFRVWNRLGQYHRRDKGDSYPMHFWPREWVVNCSK